jgi:hypothetical protein
MNNRFQADEAGHRIAEALPTAVTKPLINKRAIKRKIRSAYLRLNRLADQSLGRRSARHGEAALLLKGKELSWKVAHFPPNTDFRKVGFKVFSQWDEDGIIQYLINKIPIQNRTFIEFGVENYEESNTRFLLLNDHWQGLILDASAADIRYIQTDRIYWEFDLQAKCTWITRDNINSLLKEAGFGSDVGLLSIDVDGNDYWIWEAIEFVRPRIVIVEYSSIFGLEPISIPYKEDFDRNSAHYSAIHFGCSLAALNHLAKKKGYILIGSNIWGHNAFFVRSDVAGEFRGLEVEEAFVRSNYRDARDESGKLSYIRRDERVKLIEHLPVENVMTGEIRPMKDFFRDAPQEP